MQPLSTKSGRHRDGLSTFIGRVCMDGRYSRSCAASFIRVEKTDKTIAWETVRRFSPWAFASVGVLLFSGVLNGFFIIRSFDSLFHTAYGKTLLLKIGLFVIMLALGAVHVWMTKFSRKGASAQR